jgi:4-amino-4-deoxy-L-arabinose transferase-like glycosyltransferase
LALFLPGLGSFGVIDPSEAYYSETGREMLEKNEWITPLLNYEPWYEKPALAYWLIAISYKLLGVSEFAARLPSALLGVALVLFLYAFTRHFLRRRAALLSALILLASPLYQVVGHLSLTDMPFTACVSVALLSLLGLLTAQSSHYFWLAYISLGLAALAKGPLALMLAGLVIGGFLFTYKSTWSERWQSVRELNPFKGLLVSALVAVPWYLAVCTATKGAFAQEFFLKQNFGRAAGTADHKFPPWFYIPYLFGGAAPWTILLLGAPKVLVKGATRSATVSRRATLVKFAAVWAALVYVVLSLVPSKLPTYILPVWPALAILFGTTFDTIIRLKRGNALKWTGPVLAAVGIGALIVIPVLLHHSPQLLMPFECAAAVVALGMIGYAVGLFKGRPVLALKCLLSGTLIGTAALIPLSLHAFYNHHQSGYHQILQTVLNKGSAASTALVGPMQSSTFFYLRHHLPWVQDKEDLRSFLSKTPGPHWLIITKGRLDDLKELEIDSTVIEHHRSWYLLSVDE